VTYWISVQAKPNEGGDETGKSAQSIPVQVQGTGAGIPGAPNAPTASNVQQTSLTLTWNSVEHATSYEVANTSTGAIVYSGVATTANITGLTAGTTYQFHVRAIGATGTSGWSVATSVTTQGTGPVTPPTDGLQTPTGLNVATEGSTATVTWNAVADATGYIVEYRAVTSTSTNGAPWVAAPATSSTSATIAVGNGVRYEFRVTATAPGATSAATAPENNGLTTPAATGRAISAKADKASQGINSVTLTGLSNASAANTIITFGNLPKGVLAADLNNVTITYTDTTATITGLAAGTSYRFVVQQVSEDGTLTKARNVTAATAKFAAEKVSMVKNSQTLTGFKFTATAPRTMPVMTGFDTFVHKVTISYVVGKGSAQITYDVVIVDGVPTEIGWTPHRGERSVAAAGSEQYIASGLGSCRYGEPESGWSKDSMASGRATTFTIAGLPQAGVRYTVSVSVIASGPSGVAESAAGRANISTAKFAAPKSVKITGLTETGANLEWRSYTVPGGSAIEEVRIFTNKDLSGEPIRLVVDAASGPRISLTATGGAMEGLSLSKGTVYVVVVADGVQSLAAKVTIR
jgi:hypothetical protein